MQTIFQNGGKPPVLNLRSPNLADSLIFKCIFWITGILVIIFTKSAIFRLFMKEIAKSCIHNLLFICINRFTDILATFLYRIGDFLAKSAIFIPKISAIFRLFMKKYQMRYLNICNRPQGNHFRKKISILPSCSQLLPPPYRQKCVNSILSIFIPNISAILKLNIKKYQISIW